MKYSTVNGIGILLVSHKLLHLLKHFFTILIYLFIDNFIFFFMKLCGNFLIYSMFARKLMKREANKNTLLIIIKEDITSLTIE